MQMGHTVAQGFVAGGLVAAPALGGQVVSGLAQLWSDTIAEFAMDSDFGQFVVDLGGGAIVGIAETMIAGAIGGKGLAAQVAPFAVAGALLGASLPLIDSAAKSIVGSLSAKPVSPAEVAAKEPLRLVEAAQQAVQAAAAGGIRVSRNGGIGGIVPPGGQGQLGMHGRRSSTPSLNGVFMS